jgi:hypothetical protein
MRWYKDLAQDGTSHFDPNSGNRIDRATDRRYVFTDVISDGGGVIYGENQNGDLQWYQDLAQDGTSNWAPNSGAHVCGLSGGTVVGLGYFNPSHILSGGNGIIYTLDQSWNTDGTRNASLNWYKDLARDGTPNWAPNSGHTIATGWGFPTIEGYSSALSAAAGDGLSFYVSTGGPI